MNRANSLVYLDFSKSFTSLPSSVSVVELTYPYNPPRDQTFSPPDITTGGSDLFSISLRGFSQQLTSLTITKVVFSSEFFFLPPKSDLKAQNAPHWPLLTTLKIFFSPVTPSGEWLFEGDPAEEVVSDSVEVGRDIPEEMDEDERPPREYWKDITFRMTPDKRLMNDLFSAAGRAVTDMPCLREMALWVFRRRRVMPTLGLGLEMAESKATLVLGSRQRFEPEETVLDVWKEAVRKNTGSELVISYVAEDGG
jgi:hypothetical protein